MAKITYTDKVSLASSGSPDINTWRDNDANEVKTVVNANDTVSTSTSNTVSFDRIQGYRHGSWGVPITGSITLNTSGAVEGGCAVVIWNGSTSPTFIGGTIQSYSGDITESGTYTVYIHYINGRFNVNVFNVEGYIDVGTSTVLFKDTFDGLTIDTTTNWTLTNPFPAGAIYSQNNELILQADGSGSAVLGEDNLTGKVAYDIGTTKTLTFENTSNVSVFVVPIS